MNPQSMNVVVFGASGMVGKAAVIECLEDPGVARVVVVTRRPTGLSHAKLHEVIHNDFLDYTAVEDSLRGLDACLWCLGISSAGMSEADYTRVTYDFTVAAARALKKLNPEMRFCFVSGAGTDSSEKGRVMWARVKGKAENAVIAEFANGYAFRPGYIHPEKGVTSATRWVRVAYFFFKPLYPLVNWVFPNMGTRSSSLGRALLRAAREGAPKRVLETRDINAIAQSAIATT